MKRLERWRATPREADHLATGRDIEMDDMPGIISAVVRSGGRGEWSVVTSERHVEEVDVVAECLILTPDREVVMIEASEPWRKIYGVDEHPAAIRVRCRVPSTEGTGMAAGHMAEVTMRKDHARVPVEGFAVSVQAHSFLDGVVLLAESNDETFLSISQVIERSTPYRWNEEHVAHLKGLLDVEKEPPGVDRLISIATKAAEEALAAVVKEGYKAEYVEGAIGLLEEAAETEESASWIQP